MTRPFFSFSTPLRWLRLAAPLCGALLAAAAWLYRLPLEASMLLHMLVQLPMLAVAGALLALAAGTVGGQRGQRRSAWGALARAWARCDRHGLTGLTALLFVSAYWMIPRALEASMTVPLAELGKFASLLLLGALLPASLARATPVLQLFYLGNFCAMTAIAGMLYQDMPQQLCNAYVLDDQVNTGMGLVIASVAVAVAWCVHYYPALFGPATPPLTPTRKTRHATPATEH